MSKVTIVQVIYNSKRFIEPVFKAIFNQTFKDFNVVAVISGNDDKGKEYLMENFPSVEIIDPGYNIGFAKGHNLVFEKYNSEFFQLVNPDMIMEPNYIEEILKVFVDEKVGAATGKLFKIDESLFTMGTIVNHNGSHCVLDTTGVVINKSGRARDRGQHEIDSGQYDRLTEVDAISGAGCMYRRTALEAIKTGIFDLSRPFGAPSPNPGEGNKENAFEYFDEDFHSYWEDIDLTWRMSNAGFKCKFAPKAIGFHGRGAGSSKNGYKDVLGFIKHHKTLSLRVRQLNYQNHIFMYIKNSPIFFPQFFVREFFMFVYILFFEIRILTVLPQMFKLIRKMFVKRRMIKLIHIT